MLLLLLLLLLFIDIVVSAGAICWCDVVSLVCLLFVYFCNKTVCLFVYLSKCLLSDLCVCCCVCTWKLASICCFIAYGENLIFFEIYRMWVCVCLLVCQELRLPLAWSCCFKTWHTCTHMNTPVLAYNNFVCSCCCFGVLDCLHFRRFVHCWLLD